MRKEVTPSPRSVALDHLAILVDPIRQRALLGPERDLDRLAAAIEPPLDLGAQRVEPEARHRRDEHRAGAGAPRSRARCKACSRRGDRPCSRPRAAGRLAFRVDAELGQHGIHVVRAGFALAASAMSRTCRMRSASSTSSSVARNAAISVVGRSEMKPTVSESTRLRAAGKRQRADGRIERGEQRVLGEHRGAGQRIEQRRLAGIGVADQRHGRIRHALARLPMQRAGAPHLLELLADDVDALADDAAVGLDLGLAGAAEKAEAAALPLKMRPGPDQPALLIDEMGELDLQAPFPRPRPLPEDLEDQTGAVEHLGVPRGFEIALLHGRERMIDDDELGLLGADQSRQAPRPCRSRTASPAAVWSPARARSPARRDRWRRRGRPPRRGALAAIAGKRPGSRWRARPCPVSCRARAPAPPP